MLGRELLDNHPPSAHHSADRPIRAAVATLTGVVMTLAALAGAVVQSGAKAPDVAAGSAFDAAMRGWMAAHGVSRGSIAVMRDNRLVFAAGYGGRGATERVGIWSLSKAVTGVCIATLVQDNKLRFDDPVGPLLGPVFSKFGQPADERLRRVTVAQLLTHRSGLPRSGSGNKFAPGVAEALRANAPN